MKSFFVAVMVWNSLTGAEPVMKEPIVLPIAFATEAQCTQTAAEIADITISTAGISRAWFCREVFQRSDQ